MSEAYSRSLTEMFSIGGVVEVNGTKYQVGVGEVTEHDDFIHVEVLPGCSEIGLLLMMERIRAFTGKLVKAEIMGKEVSIPVRRPVGLSRS